MQHLTGSTGFRYVDVEVGPGVFVPRPETEVLAGWAIDHAKASPSPVVVELCAGAGAIALSVVHEVPGASVHAVELDENAYEWAQRNLAGTGVDLRLGDMADAFGDLDGTVDVVVANPPYIPLDAWESVAPEARDHDPALALWSGDDGLDAMRVVEQVAWRLLKPGGVVGAEHADVQGESAPRGVPRRVGTASRTTSTSPSAPVTSRLPSPADRLSLIMGGDELALIGAAIAVGIGAALLPVFVNAEVYVVTMGATVNSRPFLALLILIHVAATTVGKAFVFQLARRGTNKIRMVDPKPPRNRVSAIVPAGGAQVCPDPVREVDQEGQRLAALPARPPVLRRADGLHVVADRCPAAGDRDDPGRRLEAAAVAVPDDGVHRPADPVPRDRFPAPPGLVVLTHAPTS